MNDVIGHLKKNGVKPSFQRIKIFEYLATKENHPTFEMIYKELVNEIPNFLKQQFKTLLIYLLRRKLLMLL